MGEGSVVFCILGAMIGAGFASGREIMQFFSQYGPYSGVLIAVSAMAMTMLMDRAMQGKGAFFILFCGKRKKWMDGFLLSLLLCTAGGMTAAAGELWALVIPLERARGIGMAVTAGICVFFCRKNIRILGFFGFLLIPLLLLALVLCRRLPVLPVPVSSPSGKELFIGFCSALSYAGMNVALATGILRTAGERCQSRKGCRCAIWSGCAVAGLLLLFNQVLLPHAAYLGKAALPMVSLLRFYGKGGYYLAAAVLYLAVWTTLMAVLRGGITLLESFGFPLPSLAGWAISMSIAMMGFEKIVAMGYPALGFICFVLLLRPQKAEKTKNFSA